MNLYELNKLKSGDMNWTSLLEENTEEEEGA